MTGLERIGAALAGRFADRRAFIPVLSLVGARLTGRPLRVHYGDPRAYADGQAAVREVFQPDALCGPFAFALLAEAFGGQLRWYDDQPPNVRRPALSSAAEWDRLSWPDADAHPALLFLRESVRLVAAEHRGDVPVAVILPSPLDLPGLIMGLEAWLDTVLFDPPRADAIVQEVTPFFVRLARALVADGGTFLVIPSGLTSPALVTRAMAQHFAALLDLALTSIGAPVLLHHLGAPVVAHLDLLASLHGVAGYVVDELDDRARARALIGAEPLLLSGPDAARTERRTPDEVRALVAGILRERQGDPRFALATTGPDLAWTTPLENIHAMREAVAASGTGA